LPWEGKKGPNEQRVGGRPGQELGYPSEEGAWSWGVGGGKKDLLTR